MKRIITILSVTCLQTVFFNCATAQITYAAYQQNQQKTKSTKTVYLKNALTQLEGKYSVNFIYIDKIVADEKVPDIILSNNLEADLKKLLTPIGLSFKKISDKQITIYEVEKKGAEVKTTSAAEIKMVNAELAADRIIKGKVYSSSDDTPLEGASVTIKGTNRGTVTNSKGEFEINADNNEVLVVNFVGYEGYEVKIQNQQSLNISLISTSKNMENVTVVGSRSNVVRTNVERPVPVDVFSQKDMQKTGQTELAQMIHFSAPSFNSTKHGISNVTSYVDPATLRGLGPDQTLVLVNGKRRHQSAALNVNNVVGRGTVGTDLNVIPTGAIDRVEILRDGAAAQYGSDAIAGIVNLQLKRGSKGGSVNTHYGVTKEGDGKTYEESVNFGLPLGKKGGFFNTTLQAHHNDPTDRSTPFNGRVYNSNLAKDDSMIAARKFNRQIAGTKYGTSRNTSGIAFYNAEIPLANDWAIYSFGGYSYKKVTAYGFFRPPSNAKRAVLNIYPNGYAPVFPAVLEDISSTVGIKKNNKAGWSMDFSNTYGQNHINLYSNNTVNPSYGEASPTNFHGGALIFGQNTTNVDFSKSLTNLSGIQSFTLSLGAEYRMEHYQIKQGDDPSWKKGILKNTDVGASGREGFADVNAVKRSRSNAGVYADVESDITDKLLLGVAARFENYSDFGSNVSGKFSARYKFSNSLSIRGSVNRGFRAPSMHQLYYSNNADAQWLTINSVFDAYPIGHLRNDNPYVQALGVGKLKAETSLDYNTGLTLQLGKKFLMTVDAYQIDIKDRIVISAQLDATSAALSPIFAGSGYALVQFFSNAINTRTKGLDVVSTYKEKFGAESELTISAALMLNETKLHGSIRTPDKLSNLGSDLLDRSMIGLIEVAQPRDKIILSANYRYRKVEGLVRATRFGEVTAIQNNPAQDQTFGARVITDASLTYNINPKISWSIGANNIASIYPDKIALVALTGSGQTPYTRFTSQFGFMGAYYYTSVRISF
jgi:iron complex outermembrane receptor protein